ncbi:MAG TPA: PAS domain S-box protein [Methanosarcina sp.]|nr:PAS domain S-box protein [Methanosarcina sp.]
MSENLRESDVNFSGDAPWGTHIYQFYKTNKDLMDILLPYFKAGLEKNELCVWIIPEPLEVGEAKENLRKVYPEIDIYLENGRIEIILFTNWYLRDGNFDSESALKIWLEKLKYAITNGYGGLRVSENLFWWEIEDWKKLVNSEEIINNSFLNTKILSLYTYSFDRYNKIELIDLIMTYESSLAKREEKWRQNLKCEKVEESAIQTGQEAEDDLKGERTNLEKLVEERTAQLEKAYKLLQESEKDLAEAQKMAHIGSWKWNILTDKLYWSDEIYRIFGRSPQEFGGNYASFLSYIHPDDHEYLELAIKKGLSGNPYGIDYRIILDNGEERIVHTKAEIIYNEEKLPVRAKGIVQDITERQKVKEALRLSNIYNRSLIEASLDPLVTIGSNGKIMDVNGATELITGYSRNEIIGTDFSDYFTEPEKARTGYRQTFIKGEVRDYPLEIQHKDGHLTPVLYNASVYRDEAGKIIGVFAAARDITERKKAEELLKLKLGELARKREIHHRIKNNLQVISSLLDLQAERFKGRKTVQTSEVLEAFKESQERVVSIALIHEELHEGGETDVLNFSLYLKRLVENLFQIYKLGYENISLNMDLEENIFFDMDTAVPLGIVVNELVSNSLKHAFPNRVKGKIVIKLFRQKITETEMSGIVKGSYIKGTKFILIVSDDGIGISEKIDIRNSDTLGLQLISILVDQLEGELELKRDNGTEFTIRINAKEN